MRESARSNADPMSPGSLGVAGRPPSNEGTWPLQNWTTFHICATSQNSRLFAHMTAKELTCLQNPKLVAVMSQPIHDKNQRTDGSMH